MKRILVILLALIIAATSFVSCTEEVKEETHTHAVAETVEAKAATCTAEGNIKYYKCSCGKLFSDEACTKEITEANTVVAMLAHTPVKTEAKAATCTEAGYSAFYTCSVCGKYFSDEACTTETTLEEVAIAPTGHTYGDATWVRVDGKDVYQHTCSACGETEVVTATVGTVGPAGGYIFYVNANAAEDGWTYLEAVPTDSTAVTSGAMTAVTKALGGYYVVEGADTLISGTAAEVGTGSSNTALIVAKDGSIMTASGGSTASTDYAALQCANWSVKLTRDDVEYTYDDWFLPSTAEMKYYHQNIAEAKIDNTLMKYHSDYTANTTFQSSYLASKTQVKGFCVTLTENTEGEGDYFKIASKNLSAKMPFIPVRMF